MITMQIAERKAIYRKIRNLSNTDAARVMDFIENLGSDPFYNESNMKHLLAVKSDVQAGLNMSAHDLIEVDDG